jgi:thioredoxin 1
MKLAELNDAEFSALLAEEQQPLLAVFSAAWSRPARTMVPLLEDLVPDYRGLVRVALVNADTAPQALFRYGVLSLPTYIMFRRGRMTDRFIGLLTKESLIEEIEASLQKV